MSGKGMPEHVAWARDTFGIHFGNPALLERALTHKTLGPDNYERLEFLGDRILGAVIATQLYERFANEPEGKLSRRFHRLVSRETCAEVARSLGVPAHVRLNSQARSDGGADSDNILGDVMEALIGAIFLDAGPASAKDIILRGWEPHFAHADSGAKHPKSAVQEWALGRSTKSPVYELVRRSGPHHNPRFLVRLTIHGEEPVEAEGSSKQEAETRAARLFLASRRS